MIRLLAVAGWAAIAAVVAIVAVIALSSRDIAREWDDYAATGI